MGRAKEHERGGWKHEGAPELWIMGECDDKMKSSDTQAIMLMNSFRIHHRLIGMRATEWWHFLEHRQLQIEQAASHLTSAVWGPALRLKVRMGNILRWPIVNNDGIECRRRGSVRVQMLSLKLPGRTRSSTCLLTMMLDDGTKPRTKCTSGHTFYTKRKKRKKEKTAVTWWSACFASSNLQKHAVGENVVNRPLRVVVLIFHAWC